MRGRGILIVTHPPCISMPARESEAFVLRTYPYREADLIVSFIARDRGKLRGIANRARKPKSTFGSGLERLAHVRAFYFERQNRELVRLDRCELIGPPVFLRSDYATSVALDYVAEICDRLLPEHEPNDAFFRLMTLVLERIWTGLTTEAPDTAPKNGGPAAVQAAGAPKREAAGIDETPGWLWLTLTYFSLWAVRLGGWMPPLNTCIQSGAELGPDETAYFERMHPGLFCVEYRTSDSWAISAASRSIANGMLKTSLREMDPTGWDRKTAADLRRFLTQRLEDQFEGRLKTAAALAEL